MKSIKISLVAALLVGTSAFAIENTKVSGDANVFYHTQDAAMTPNVLAGTDGGLFEKDSSAADASLNLAITSDLVENDTVKVSGKVGYTILSTLGLENNLVSNVWGTSHSATTATGAKYAGSSHGGAFGGAKVENASYLTEAYVTVASGKSALQLGRMELDTPLVFTETWTIEKNTFESAVVVNQDIPGTTIVGAYVGNGNGNETFGQNTNGAVAANSLAMGGVVNEDGTFNTFGTDGAYTLGVVNNSFEPLTAQLWYYRATNLAEAIFLQADLNCQAVPGLMAGVQYSTLDIDALTDTGSIYSAMVGYDIKDTATIKLAYSQTDDTVGAGANLATGSGASTIYTEAWWMYGFITAADTGAVNLTVEAPVAGVDLGLYLTQTMSDTAAEMRDLTITASKEFGPLAASLAFINYEVDDGSDAVNNIQAYLTLAF